ncbi:MAG: hypothetical protein COU31_01190 [Candidatus Magasanikbacteria bacterium CG10_big_fil_rev_8_21_14_0_10_40_10]|uniref:Uncharacterized protein n=1 Tax=Candidatus Magasanikbacteria bacterium CG10_big_fil_rev_8_21_14_0_10_40_10 TaxID=1974648 RepID=A0A2M6W4P4_9BACT|nr:MAG: hypothetical protein COU31_01190 [Candidatus Magasanikbacteria bacterium CG10_big_fil_rev_8_21_14_0_10_40_10]
MKNGLSKQRQKSLGNFIGAQNYFSTLSQVLELCSQSLQKNLAQNLRDNEKIIIQLKQIQKDLQYLQKRCLIEIKNC